MFYKLKLYNYFYWAYRMDFKGCNLIGWLVDFGQKEDVIEYIGYNVQNVQKNCVCVCSI